MPRIPVNRREFSLCVALAVTAGLVFGVHRRRVTALGNGDDWRPR